MSWELIKGAIGKKLLETTAKAVSNTSTSTKTTSTAPKKSTSSNNATSGGSYAYDPSGNKVSVTIKDGQSYLSDGSRVGTGYTVQTGGGIYKMTDSGGVKVDSHNSSNLVSGGKAMSQSTGGGTISNDRNNTSSSRTWTDRNGKTTYADTISSIAPRDSYSGLNYDFESKNNSIIKKLAEYGIDGKPVTMDVAKNMLASNIEQSMKGEAPMYDGGGVIKTDEWNEIVNDYKLLKEAATSSAMNTTTTDAYGRELTGGDILSDLRNGGATIDYSLGQNLSGYSQDELAYGYNQVYGQGGGIAPMGAGGLTQGVVQQAPIQGGTIDVNMWADAIRAMSSGGQSSFVIDNHIQFPGSSNPTDGMYKAGQNYVVNQNGQLTEITEDDYVAYLASLIDL